MQKRVAPLVLTSPWPRRSRRAAPSACRPPGRCRSGWTREQYLQSSSQPPVLMDSRVESCTRLASWCSRCTVAARCSRSMKGRSNSCSMSATLHCPSRVLRGGAGAPVWTGRSCVFIRFCSAAASKMKRHRSGEGLSSRGTAPSDLGGQRCVERARFSPCCSIWPSTVLATQPARRKPRHRNGLRREQRVVDAAKAQADDEDHRQAEVHGQVRPCPQAAHKGTRKPPTPSTSPKLRRGSTARSGASTALARERHAFKPRSEVGAQGVRLSNPTSASVSPAFCTACSCATSH